MRTLLVLLALLCGTVQCAGAGFLPCPSQLPYFKSVQESHDERVSAIFAEVVALTDLQDKKFALCESEEFSPAVFPLAGTDGRGFAVVMPRALASFADTVIKGLIAHELGHVARIDLVGGKSVELQADLQAAAWVGTDTVVVALRAMQKNIHRFPKWQQDLGRYQLEYRINALVYGLYEVY